MRSRLYSATSRPALLTYPRPPRRAPCGRDRHLVRGASAIGRDRLTTEERLSDIVEILAHGLLWLDVLRDYHGSIRSHNFRRFVTEGGLISFGIDQAALYRLAASYVDRILKGEKPADLPVQAPTKYETVLTRLPPWLIFNRLPLSHRAKTACQCRYCLGDRQALPGHG